MIAHPFIEKFPFEVSFTLQPLFDYWKEMSKAETRYTASNARFVLDHLEKKPNFVNSLSNYKALLPFQEEIDFLFSGLISPYQKEKGIFGAGIPYSINLVYSTENFKKLLGQTNEDVNKSIFGQKGKNKWGPALHAYGLILKKFYNIDVSFDIPFFNIKKADEASGIVKYYQMNIDLQFLNIRQVGKKAILSTSDINKLIENYYDLDLWKKLIPPENYVFEGFNMLRIVENTAQQAVSSIQNKLLDKESILNREKLGKIEKRIKSLLGLKDIRIGVAVFNESLKSFTLFRNTWNTILEDSKLICSNYHNSIYERISTQSHPIVVSDLTKLSNKTIIETKLIEQGIRSLIIIPLHYEEELVGMLEIASPNPDELNTASLVMTTAVFPAFGLAAGRQALELENHIKAKLQEEFTAIHPTVEWKFEEVATDLLNMEMGNIPPQKPSIVFKDVFPLFGVCDIKSSSNERNNAIKNDLLEQIKTLCDVIDHIKRTEPLPILDHFRYTLQRNKQDIEATLSTGDEVKILSFIKNEVEPVLKHLEGQNVNLTGTIEVYFDMLDDELGIFYKKRKDFETSVAIINETVGNLIDKREEEAQQMFPHYFEKYRTDGIEHSIYIGESLTQNRSFNAIYLKNIRLWQLITMCEITRATGMIKADLPLAIETTQMILVHRQPLSIRFREDEKKFDVDGAYNLRYEITKKRIDKAFIKGTDERVVQPGHLAIIYSQQSDKEEYAKFIDFLIEGGYFEEEVEYFKIEDLQGILGLEGIRLKIKNISNDMEKEQMEKILTEARKSILG